jgi:hypothetical protein
LHQQVLAFRFVFSTPPRLETGCRHHPSFHIVLVTA